MNDDGDDGDEATSRILLKHNISAQIGKLVIVILLFIPNDLLKNIIQNDIESDLLFFFQ